MPRSNEKSNRRQHILQALARMLETSASARITTAALAEEVGFSEAALYRHFPSKTRMFEGLIDFAEEALFSRIRVILDSEDTTAGRCYRILQLMLTFAERNPGITRILTGEALVGETERLYSRVSQLFDRVETQLRQVIREGEVREGLQTAMTTTDTVTLMMAVAEGKVRQYVRSGFSRLPTTAWQDQWQVLSQGLFR
jgi:TetR/AcrR family transcriptional regulator